MEETLGRTNLLEDLMKNLGLEKYKSTKLTLASVLSIGEETCKKIEARSLENVPWCFLQKLMAGNGTARNIQPQDTDDGTFDFNEIDPESLYVSKCVNPLDVVCALLYCSDHLLQTQILLNMSRCQFAVPLLVPSGDGSDCTLFLWAMRDIVKIWRPQSMREKKGFAQDHVVSISTPIFSFVRIGEYGSSKSHILNQVLSSEGQLHDYFLHENMSGGNTRRKISDGLVEISWYFPTGSDSDVFLDPLTIANLRGDLLHHRKQIGFLTNISTTVFIFVENIDEEARVLSEIDISSDTFFFIINITSNDIKKGMKMFLEKLSHVGNSNYLFTISNIDNNNEARTICDFLIKLFPDLKVNKRILILKRRTSQGIQIVKQIQALLRERLARKESYSSLEKSAQVASDLGIMVDENLEECEKTKLRAQDITKHITDLKTYKKTNMKLRGDYWTQISKNEKEMCRMRGQGSRSGEEYRSHLISEIQTLRRKQYQEEIPDGIRKFLAALLDLSPIEKMYFLNWMNFYLDSKSNNSDGKVNPDNNLGLEHFLREIGQFYEAECSVVKNEASKITSKNFGYLPGIGAELLLNGFPLELIDGDASNIPLQWITDVLTELDNKMGGQCRMRVITVLGVQSTGKSTLLNTMFGLQFPVASGRCTRGAFMTLITVKENFQEELGCEFILVIDTEGLKAPELSSLDDNYEHNNELATLVVGLSDITLVNMAMENTAEMKDILQIVVHAFLRMKEIGKKPNCQFVHQNVSDVSAHEQNTREKKLLLDQLDEMTKVASKMESNSDITQFCEIIEYDLEKHNWYNPSLWHGVPPMASVSPGYSEKTTDLKMFLMDFLKQKTKTSDCYKMKEFIEWTKSLWSAVKHEKFIFSFRNSIIADAYNQLCMKYSDLEWRFRKAVHSWMAETENEIKNKLSTQKESDMWTTLNKTIQTIVTTEANKMETALREYFESNNKQVTLVKKYEVEFINNVSQLQREHQYYLKNKCQEVLEIERENKKIKSVQGNYQNMAEQQVNNLLKRHKVGDSKLTDAELEAEFEAMWKETSQDFSLHCLEKQNIGEIMLEHLRRELKNKPGYINEQLLSLNLENCQSKEFELKTKHLEGSQVYVSTKRFSPEFWSEAVGVAHTIFDRCNRHIGQVIHKKKDYHDIHFQQLLDIINEGLRNKTVEKYEFKPSFELKVKSYVLGKAATLFQKMHEDFINENDPKHCVEALKLDYFNIFKRLYNEKDDNKSRAQRFCDLCLKPALCDYVNANLGSKIIDDILKNDKDKYGNITDFQSILLKNLLEEKKFPQYVEYCLQYEIFTVKWIKKYIILKYQDHGRLDPLITAVVTRITGRVREVLEDQTFAQTPQLEDCLNIFCKILKKDLVISQNMMSVVTFQNSSNSQKFFQYVLSFLPDVEDKVKAEFQSLNIEDLLCRVTINPQEELFKQVFGCGKQCPFCKAPCEAGGSEHHEEHFSSIHRPQGLGRYRFIKTQILCHEVCTTDVVTDRTFRCHDTNWEDHPYKEYRTIYPDWKIQPDPSIEASVYWKYVFKMFNKEFAEEYKAKEAKLPEEWYKITKEQALQSLTTQ